MASEASRVLRLLEPQDEPDIIECDGRLYVPDEECEFVPEEFDTVWDEEDQCLRIALPSLPMIVIASRVRNAAKS